MSLQNRQIPQAKGGSGGELCKFQGDFPQSTREEPTRASKSTKLCTVPIFEFKVINLEQDTHSLPELTTYFRN
jgi:hypothetical protein